MKKLSGRKDGDQGDSEVIVQVLVLRFKMDFWMAQGVALGLVDPGIKGGDIDVKDLLPWVNLMVKGHSASSSTKEGISGLKGRRGRQRRKERRDGGCRVNTLFPLAFPFNNDLKTGGAEAL